MTQSDKSAQNAKAPLPVTAAVNAIMSCPDPPPGPWYLFTHLPGCWLLAAYNQDSFLKLPLAEKKSPAQSFTPPLKVTF